MKDRRQDPREPRRIPLVFWDRDLPEDRRTGFTSDTSISGVFIQTNRPLRSGTRIQIEFDRSPGSFLAEGMIVRSVTVPPDLRKVKPGGMGVRLLGIDALVRELSAQDLRRTQPTPASGDQPSIASQPVGDETDRSEPAVHTPDPPEPADAPPARPKRRTVFEREGPPPAAARRHPAAARAVEDPSPEDEQEDTPAPAPTFALAFRSFDELRQAYESDLKMGGAFVPTEEPAAVDGRVSVRLMLPLGRGRIEVTARVVQHLPGGMGIVVDDPEGLSDDLLEILENE